MSRAYQLLCLLLLAGSAWPVLPFSMHGTFNFGPTRQRGHRHVGADISGVNRVSLCAAPESSGEKLREEAERLLQRAKELRADIPAEEKSKTVEKGPTETVVSPWAVKAIDNHGVGYRLYVDIGREEGTWMDPRWGASGKRIEFTVDVCFLTEGDGAFADKEVQANMVKDNFGGKSTPIYVMQSAPKARLRSGFDSMPCRLGGYRIDANKNSATVRFYIDVDGTAEAGAAYG